MQIHRIIGLLAIVVSCTQVEGQAVAARRQFYSVSDFTKVLKIDAHMHVYTEGPEFANEAQRDNFLLLTINLDDVNEPPPMEEQQRFALAQIHAHPRRIAYTTSFSIRKFNEPGWLQQQLDYMKNSFDSGAIGVKVYKVIGMSLRDTTGKLVMIDDPRFDPLLDFIQQNDKTVLGHLGEPKNCWLPAEQMTINGDKQYFTSNPVYHMYKHPEFPSYEQQVAARDHMLEKHPGLRFVGAHLGSLEWSVDELAKRLDKFPTMAVDMAARIDHLQYQASHDWKKVHDFLIKYQDRLLYATDIVIDSTSDPKKVAQRVRNTWEKDWKFFVSDEQMTTKDFDGGFKGMKLPASVIDKIYRLNAEKWYPGLAAAVKLKAE